MELSEYRFSGDTSPTMIESFRRWLVEHPLIVTREIPHPEDVSKKLHAMLESITELGSDVGLDLAPRIPREENVHLLQETDYTELLAQFGDDGHASKATVIPYYRDVLVKWIDERPAIDTFTGINHDVLHLVSAVNIFLNPETRRFDAYLGYGQRNGKFKMITEALTEMANFYLVRQYWKHQPELVSFSRVDFRVMYEWELLLIDYAIKQAAARRQEPYRGVLKGLIRGLMTRDERELRPLFENRYADAKTLFADLPRLTSFEQTKDVAVKLRLDNLTDEMVKGRSEIPMLEDLR